MKPTEIRLNRDDLKCLENGGSIEYEIKDGEEVRAVVCLSIKSDVKGFRQPVNAAPMRERGLGNRTA